MGVLDSLGVAFGSFRISCECRFVWGSVWRVEGVLIGVDWFVGYRGIKCLTASLGGVTLWAVANDNDKILNVGW